jgi:uncharacterized membrane protein
VAIVISKEEEDAIVAAIAGAEMNTSGEIRVHVESVCKKEPFERAVELFHKLEMDKTELRNGVLIYVALDDKKLAIIGDAGINAVVPEYFWDATKERMILHFKEGKFADGIAEAVTAAGFHLKQYFPRESNDTNELSNELSRGE